MSTATHKSVGITLTPGTSVSWLPKIVNFTPPGQSVEDIDVSDQSTTSALEFDPAVLYDPGEVSFDIEYNGDAAVPVGVKQTWTIGLRPKLGQTSGASLAFSGYIKEHSPQGSYNNKMMASITIKVSGAVTHTQGA